MGKMDSDEKEILTAFESGKLKRVKNRNKEIEHHKKVAEATFKKDSRIRISSKDLRTLQKRALAEGIPYQTLIASVLYKYVERQLSESGANEDLQQALKSRY